MRTLLAAALLAALIVTGIAIVVPLVFRPIVIAAVQAASPFGDQQLDVDVDLNVFGLLTGTVDRVHVRGSELKHGDVTIGALDVTVRDAATSGRSFKDIEGTLASVRVPLVDGTGMIIDRISLDGSSDDTIAMASLDRSAAISLIQATFADTGFEVTNVELGAGTVRFEILGSPAEVPIGVEDGGIVMVDPFGTGSLELVTPGPDDGWQFTGIAVSQSGMTIDATIDPERLLAGR